MAAGMASAFRQPVEAAGVDQGAFAGRCHAGDSGVFLAGVEHCPDGQVKGLGEVEVALVMGRDGHDGARAVVGQDIVGGPDGQLFAVERVGRVAAGEDAGLFAFGGLALDFGERLDLFPVGVQGGRVLVGDEFDGERRVGGDDEERGAVEGVRAGGEDGDVLGGLPPSASITKLTWAPSERPIQFFCMARTRSGQCPRSSSMSSSSRSA